MSSNEAFLLDFNTGTRLMHYSTLGDCQAIGAVGNTTVAGYHNNSASAGNPTSANYFGIQLENTTLGTPTTWDPRVNGNQNNADGGNNGVQAMYVDQTTQTVYLGGAFLHWNGTTGSNHQSLIAFSFAQGSPTAPDAPTGVTASPGNATATVSWTAPVRRRQPDHRLHGDVEPGRRHRDDRRRDVGCGAGFDQRCLVHVHRDRNQRDRHVGSFGAVEFGDAAGADGTGRADECDGDRRVMRQASVSWTAPADGGSPITSYTVTSHPGRGDGEHFGCTSATVSGLTNGDPYTFTVTATNGVGTRPVGPVEPGDATGADGAGCADGCDGIAGNASASVSWTAPADGGSPISSYTVTSTRPGGRRALRVQRRPRCPG